MLRHLLVRSLLLLVAVGVPRVVAGQDHTTHQVPATNDSAAWRWHADAAVFVGLNHQERKFRDFTVWESQNWMMAGGERMIGKARLRVNSMLSFEPFTLRNIGSPQVFQTGETYQGGALID